MTPPIDYLFSGWKLLRIAALAAGLLTTGLYGQVVVFSESFDAPAGTRPATELGWHAHLGVGGTAADEGLTVSGQAGDPAMGYPNGFLRINFPGTGQNLDQALVWTEASVTGEARSTLLSVQWLQGNRVDSTHLRLAVRIGEEWFASERVAAPFHAVTSDGGFSQIGSLNGAQPVSFTWSETGWRAVDFDGAPGNSAMAGLALGPQLPGPLPSADITAVGFFLDAEPLLFGDWAGVRRIDSLEVVALVPEPHTAGLLAGILALLAALVVRCRRPA